MVSKTLQNEFSEFGNKKGNNKVNKECFRGMIEKFKDGTYQQVGRKDLDMNVFFPIGMKQKELKAARWNMNDAK